MLQIEKPEDFVLATGIKHSVRELIELAFKYLDTAIIWEGKGEKEVGKDAETGKVIVAIDPTYYRPTEVDLLI